MPIFARRRLQAMLDELSPSMALSKLKDIRSRLENKRVEQALPAEMELAVLWSLSKLGPIEIEPDRFGKSRPEAYTENLFPPHACLVEVTALSDGRMSQEDDMRRVAKRLVDLANTHRKGQGKHLHFDFVEESGYTNQGYFRRRKVEQAFTPDATTTQALTDWLGQQGARAPLEVVQDGTHVVVSWHAFARHPHSNFFSSMPAETYSLEDNPLYEALEVKARQLSSSSFHGLRCVVLADSGAHLLRDLTPTMNSPGAVTGEQVINHFLRTAAGAVDVVLVLSPHRRSPVWSLPDERLYWQATMRVRPGLVLDEAGARSLVAQFPRPRFEGYQARSLQQQAAYRHDARGWYVGTKIVSTETVVTIKVSARALLALLADQITLEQFQHFTGLKETSTRGNLLAHRLRQGDVLSSVSIEPGGLDEDDDRFVFELKTDPAASLLKLPEAL